MLVLSLIQSDGLTFGDVVRGIPHDTPAVIVYILVGLFVGMIVVGSRRKPHT
jgi:hypothetical protein